MAVADDSVEQEVQAPDALTSPLDIEDEATGDAVTVLPTQVIFCPTPRELQGASSQVVPIVSEQLPAPIGDPEQQAQGYGLVGAAVQVVRGLAWAASMVRASPALVRTLPVVSRGIRVTAPAVTRAAPRPVASAAARAPRAQGASLNTIRQRATALATRARSGVSNTRAAVNQRVSQGRAAVNRAVANTQNRIQAARTSVQNSRAQGALRRYTPAEQGQFLRAAGSRSEAGGTLLPRNPVTRLAQVRAGERVVLQQQRAQVLQAARQSADKAAQMAMDKMNNPWVKRMAGAWNFAASWVLVDQLVKLVLPDDSSDQSQAGQAQAASAAPVAGGSGLEPTPTQGQGVAAANSATAAGSSTGVSTASAAGATGGSAPPLPAAPGADPAVAPASQLSQSAPAAMVFDGRPVGNRTVEGQIGVLREITAAALRGDRQAKEAIDILAAAYEFCPDVALAIRHLGGGASLERLGECQQ